MNQIIKKLESDPKELKNKRVVRYNIKLNAYNAVILDYWIVLQNQNPKNYVNSDGTVDPFGEKQQSKHVEVY